MSSARQSILALLDRLRQTALGLAPIARRPIFNGMASLVDTYSAYSRPDEILHFWFGAGGISPASRAAFWFRPSAEVDQEIRSRYESDVLRALATHLDEWAHAPRSRLALILLLDQFPRNIYRNTPLAYAGDNHSLFWSMSGINIGLDLALSPIERVFFYLPLEHAEDLRAQERAVECFGRLLEICAPQDRPAFEEFYDYAVKHREVIERFHRFPHRNEILGRISTPYELRYLSQPGSGF